MGAFDLGLGNPPINSTYAITTNPSTATLCAELDSTQLGTKNYSANQSGTFRVNWLLGADTNATWQIESCTSTSLSAGADIFFVKTPSGQSGQYVTSHVLGKDYRLRARVQSSITSAVTAYISAEQLT